MTQIARSLRVSDAGRTSKSRQRQANVCGKDCLSPLPLEVFFQIIRYMRDALSPRPYAPLQTLSTVNKAIRAKCVAAGLFQSILVTVQQGPKSIRNISYLLRMKNIPPSYVHTLTIIESVLGECPSEFARLLQLLPLLKFLRIKGSRGEFGFDSQAPLNCGRLISYNGILHKTLSSKSYHTKLEHVEIINMSITQIVIDIIATIPGYDRLTLTSSQIVHQPDIMQSTLCNVRYLVMNGGDSARTKWTYRFLRNAKLCHSITYLAISLYTFVDMLKQMQLDNLSCSQTFPNLKTLHLNLANIYFSRRLNISPTIKVQNVVCAVVQLSPLVFDLISVLLLIKDSLIQEMVSS